MKESDKDLAYQILDIVLEAFEGKPELASFQVELDNTPRPPGMSLSSAGREPRYLAHMAKGSPRQDSQPRYLANMDMGSIGHDYLRWCIANHPDIAMTDAERTVNLNVNGKQVPGHIDGFIEFDGKRILIDIKFVDHYTFNGLDPRNTETNWWARGRKWNAGNFVFDAIEMFKHDDFKRYYIGQVASYEQALASEGEKWDATAFILCNRNTSHLGIGMFTPSEEEFGEILRNTELNMKDVFEEPDPLEHAPCLEAAEGASPHIVCQYCPYLHECFDVKTKVFRGKPRMVIQRIR